MAEREAANAVAALTTHDKHFGRWWTARVETIGPEGIEVDQLFYGCHGGELVQLHGLESARAFARDLAAAIEYAEETGAEG
ncbi:hypothetical protein [Demequina sp. NBRC 110055]|uniref:hypothetical protein n=1 Tax=Demequina sp. NBRC 110055 TaxID=1570344 RepID=UPI000A032688|nr:hypothetical protein [Demequina sp. NBRC 110055]